MHFCEAIKSVLRNKLPTIAKNGTHLRLVQYLNGIGKRTMKISQKRWDAKRNGPRQTIYNSKHKYFMDILNYYNL